MSEALRQIASKSHAGAAVAIPSVCSAHPEVLFASLSLARDLGRPLVIEATSNQVNQFGGYTGMDAAGFVAFVGELTQEAGLDPGQVILGGDHLGPQAWRQEPAAQAMAKARDLVASYARAGITKIHLDCSEGCAGEPAQLTDDLVAARAADLARACAEAAARPEALIFVIGTEVPPPGGARLDGDGQVVPTSPQALAATVAAHQEAFAQAGLTDLWLQVAGVVAQPGVEFAPDHLHPLPMARDPGLLAALAPWPGLCLEAHSTDYQAPQVFPRLAQLGFAFQKVGPALTFAWRQALYRLDALLAMLRPETQRLPPAVERALHAAPEVWAGHYPNDARALWHVSYADRLRYLWPRPELQEAVEALFAALADLDLPWLAYRDGFSEDVLARAEAMGPERARAVALAHVQAALAPYFFEARHV